MFVCSLHSHWNSFTLHLLYTAFFPILFPTIYIIENVSCIPRYEIMHFILFAAFLFIDMGLQKKARNDAAGQLSALLYKHSALLRYLMQQWQSFYSKFFFLKVEGAHLPIASFNWGRVVKNVWLYFNCATRWGKNISFFLQYGKSLRFSSCYDQGVASVFTRSRKYENPWARFPRNGRVVFGPGKN